MTTSNREYSHIEQGDLLVCEYTSIHNISYSYPVLIISKKCGDRRALFVLPPFYTALTLTTNPASWWFAYSTFHQRPDAE